MTTHDPAADTTLFLVNLGTPDEPTAPAVSRFLREFLLDPRVVAIPRLLWQPLLQWVILPRRSPVVAEKYAQVWLPGEWLSPSARPRSTMYIIGHRSS